jgi:hypothetical protein
MAYSIVGIVNLSLGRIGIDKQIASLSEDSVVARKANAVWEYIRDEVLEAKDWKFAKTRVALSKLTSTPVFGYDYAYGLPPDFLRVVINREKNPSYYPSGAYATALTSDQILIRETAYHYAIEALADSTRVLVTDYDNDEYDLYLTYIRKEDDPAKYSPNFINALAFRMAAELCMSRTESRPKFGDMMALYEAALKRADEIDSSLDYNDDIGNSDWENAGR